MRNKLLYVYILKCSDNTYYVGVTNDPERRLNEHLQGISSTSYTFSRRPLERVYLSKGFSDFNAAIAREKQIKKWSRKKKEAFIEGKFDELKKLAECKNETSHKNLPYKDEIILSGT